MRYRRLYDEAKTDADRGKLILDSASRIRNHGAFVIEDVIEGLLRSGAWRTYTFPNGDHHEWLDREFDYFISSQQLDWEYIGRTIVKPEVLVLLAQHSGPSPTAGPDRRALEDVRSQFPHLALVHLVSDDVRKISVDKTKSKAFIASGRTRAPSRGYKDWIFQVKRKPDASIDDKARAIVEKLQKKEPEVAKRVYQMLHAAEDSARRRRANGSVEPETGTRAIASPQRQKERA